MARKRDVIARVGAETSEFDARLNASIKRLDDLGAMGRKAGAVLAAGFATATVAAAALTKAGLQAIDAQAKLSRTLGGTIDGLRGLQIAGGDAGVKIETVNDAAYKLSARLGDIQRQGGPAGKILADLGLSAQELARLDVDQRFARIADAMQEAGLSAAQQSDALRQLGIEQKEVVQLFMGGGDAIREARKEVDRFGLSVSEVDAAKIEAANDAMARIGRTVEGVRNSLAIAVAPILQEIAERITQISEDSGGFAKATSEAAEVAGRKLAKVADVAQGLRVVFKGVELIAIGFGATVVSVVQASTEALNRVVDGSVSGINAAIQQLNKLPGLDIEALNVDWTNSEGMQSFRRMAEELRDKVGVVRGELHDMAMQPLPSAQVEKFFEDVQKRAQESAEKIVEARSRIGMGGAEGFGTGQDEAARAAEAAAQEAEERQREQLEGRLQLLREHYMTESQLELQRYAEQLNLLQDAEDMRIASFDELYSLREQAESEHQRRMTGIAQSEADKRAEAERRAMQLTVDSLISGLGAAFNAIASHNKKRFEQAKTFAKAEAALNAYRAIQQVWADEQLPFYAKIAATAVTALRTAANISAINATQFGGGTTPSAAGTPTVNGAPVAGAPPQERGPSIFVTLQGETQSTSAVRELLDRISDTVRDGGQLVLSPG